MVTTLSLKKIIESHFSIEDVDCTILVALKIIDKKCQMDDESKALFMNFYDGVEGMENKLFDQNIYMLIRQSREKPCLEVLDLIHQKRVNAMEQIDKTVMKAFKKRVRELV